MKKYAAGGWHCNQFCEYLHELANKIVLFKIRHVLICQQHPEGTCDVCDCEVLYAGVYIAEEWIHVISGYLWGADTCDEWTPVRSGYRWKVSKREEGWMNICDDQTYM